MQGKEGEQRTMRAYRKTLVNQSLSEAILARTAVVGEAETNKQRIQALLQALDKEDDDSSDSSSPSSSRSNDDAKPQPPPQKVQDAWTAVVQNSDLLSGMLVKQENSSASWPTALTNHLHDQLQQFSILCEAHLETGTGMGADSLSRLRIQLQLSQKAAEGMELWILNACDQLDHLQLTCDTLTAEKNELLADIVVLRHDASHYEAQLIKHQRAKEVQEGKLQATNQSLGEKEALIKSLQIELKGAKEAQEISELDCSSACKRSAGLEVILNTFENELESARAEILQVQSQLVEAGRKSTEQDRVSSVALGRTAPAELSTPVTASVRVDIAVPAVELGDECAGRKATNSTSASRALSQAEQPGQQGPWAEQKGQLVVATFDVSTSTSDLEYRDSTSEAGNNVRRQADRQKISEITPRALVKVPCEQSTIAKGPVFTPEEQQQQSSFAPAHVVEDGRQENAEVLRLTCELSEAKKKLEVLSAQLAANAKQQHAKKHSTSNLVPSTSDLVPTTGDRAADIIPKETPLKENAEETTNNLLQDVVSLKQKPENGKEKAETAEIVDQLKRELTEAKVHLIESNTLADTLKLANTALDDKISELSGELDAAKKALIKQQVLVHGATSTAGPTKKKSSEAKLFTADHFSKSARRTSKLDSLRSQLALEVKEMKEEVPQFQDLHNFAGRKVSSAGAATRATNGVRRRYSERKVKVSPYMPLNSSIPKKGLEDDADERQQRSWSTPTYSHGRESAPGTYHVSQPHSNLQNVLLEDDEEDEGDDDNNGGEERVRRSYSTPVTGGTTSTFGRQRLSTAKIQSLHQEEEKQLVAGNPPLYMALQNDKHTMQELETVERGLSDLYSSLTQGHCSHAELIRRLQSLNSRSVPFLKRVRSRYHNLQMNYVPLVGASGSRNVTLVRRRPSTAQTCSTNNSAAGCTRRRSSVSFMVDTSRPNSAPVGVSHVHVPCT
jgi:hypothetical protein